MRTRMNKLGSGIRSVGILAVIFAGGIRPESDLKATLIVIAVAVMAILIGHAICILCGEDEHED